MSKHAKVHGSPIRKQHYHQPIPGSDKALIYAALKRLARDGYYVVDLGNTHYQHDIPLDGPYVFWRPIKYIQTYADIFDRNDNLSTSLGLDWGGDPTHVAQRFKEAGCYVSQGFSSIHIQPQQWIHEVIAQSACDATGADDYQAQWPDEDGAA